MEAVETIKGGLEGLVTGEVLTCARHPNADKLSVTTVSVGGDEPLHIVCGAPNVAAGQKVIVATVGTTVYPTEGDPITIKKAKIRGEESAGMICAEDEIGLGNSHAGIMILPSDTPVGIPASKYFNLPATDHAIHIGLTPNRSDANSHIGVARDVCAYLSHHRGGEYRVVTPVSFFDIDETSSTDGWPAIKVTIEAPEACPRYTGMGISGVKVGPSPEWLQRRLAAIGVRSINNIVDITNYVLHEYGQPLHAFDADRLSGGKIIVRHMPEGTVFTALDGKERKLRSEDLMICDESGPVAMGGVFGGKDSGITEATTNVFLESAYFAPMSIRRTSMHHGLRTDAATHFEKAVDINNVLHALYRAAAMIAEITGGTVQPHVVDVYPTPLKTTEVSITYEHIRRLSGKHYSNEAVRNILLALGFGILGETGEMLQLSVPSNKTDVSQPADIVEEILRIDGLDNVEIPQRLNISLIKALPTDRHIRERMAALLCGMGMQEIVTNSIVNSKYYPGNETLVRMINSLSADLDCMRPSLLEGALEVTAYNCNRKSTDLALFEFGNVYARINDKYEQYPRLSLLVTGNAHAQQWQYKAQPADIYYLKGLVSNMLAASGITGVATSYDGDTIVWKWKNREMCRMMQVPKDKRTAFEIKQEVYYAEIHWDAWSAATAAVRTKYAEVPKFPAVQRDLAIVLDEQVSYQQVQDVTAQLKLAELRTYGLFDVFASEKLGAGKKSYALNYTFQLQDRTLTDAETEQLMRKLADAYKNKLNAVIRD